jgi:hypothetical protein
VIEVWTFVCALRANNAVLPRMNRSEPEATWPGQEGNRTASGTVRSASDKENHPPKLMVREVEASFRLENGWFVVGLGTRR